MPWHLSASWGSSRACHRKLGEGRVAGDGLGESEQRGLPERVGLQRECAHAAAAVMLVVTQQLRERGAVRVVQPEPIEPHALERAASRELLERLQLLRAAQDHELLVEAEVEAGERRVALCRSRQKGWQRL